MGRKYKGLKLTEEQRSLIDRWYAYAMAVAYDRARKPFDEDEIRSIVHDALIDAARYYEEGRGCTTFRYFYINCLLRRMSRVFKKRIARSNKQVQLNNHNISYTPEEPSFEVDEFIDYLRHGLSDNHKEITYKIYYMNMKSREMAKLSGCTHQNILGINKLAIHNMKRIAERSYIPKHIDKGE